ncbi:MAG: TIR domain-containing protein [Chlorobaculum sp.]|nr:TIR domain-containing protein [Chlorobaculum sp.]
MQIEVFVSYAREDCELVSLIVKKLRDTGFAVWRDQEDMRGNAPFSDEIKNAILSAQCVLVVWTQNSCNAPYVRAEAALASKHCKLVQLSYGIKPDVDSLFEFGITQCSNVDIENLDDVVHAVRNAIGLRGPKEHIVESSVIGPAVNFGNPGFRYLVPGKDLFLSFYPCGESGVFLTMRFETTSGWISTEQWKNEADRLYIESRTIEQNEETSEKKVTNQIYLIQDPLRPFTIQIGELRAMRPNAEPGYISGTFHKSLFNYLQLSVPWMSMTLAEIISEPESLEELSKRIEQTPLNEDDKKKINKLIARNPNAPAALQEKHCLFCNEEFKSRRRLSTSGDQERYGAYIMANDFPFGPYFHYLSVTSEPVHSWAKLSYAQLRGVNLISHQFLQVKENLRNADGIGFGFNSTVRHLVLGNNTHSSAGASIPHIHKQLWGMSAATSNLADQLLEVCQAYENHGIDYQGQYLKALDEAGYVVWKDQYVMLYVPYGQSSKYEMQAMLIKPHGSFRDLDEAEVISLTIAEYIALRIFSELDINSFNHVMLSKLFHDKRAPRFRPVEIFITREVDLAVSELSSHYVVDQHPWDSRNKIMQKWGFIEKEVLEEVKAIDPDFVPNTVNEKL